MVHIKKGELTQEEKELLEVIGKGRGAGQPYRQALPTWPGAWRSPGDPGLRLCEVGSLGPGTKRQREKRRWGASGGRGGWSSTAAAGRLELPGLWAQQAPSRLRR